MSPTVLRIGPYRLYFYSHELNEPPHIHVERDDLASKFWLAPVVLARNYGFSPKELSKLQRIVEEKELTLMEAWNEFFGS